ncbi:TPA: ATP-binding cassette domain-containing protein [Streptococcus equi subsp. zooepidemicus]|uniref:ATP-binding cassette domain-containing protein n=1 Tax=Streptococcus equi TaxID=1336 RepID=UPI001E45B9F9|nr:ATP-binding cassette domain-containing protein [Streptococcus equi]MCD3416474.1 ATP-binding cassette domain-containing protein [Streptococcus equi subsp. zooepidemicus]HEL1145469.1 ATP-binding cassette domain-containing protein [Streptococcus equi subsp. zooepidemicus]HEL1147152.1 ATP-binding cassette domain-containing protein [Streptococcus equi subsp. zooepidemicus]
METVALSKQYKNFKALDGLNMHVPKGSIYGFVGKNGAGKTTLIRLICGLQMPTGGEYKLYGVKNTDKEISKARRRIGAVVETPSIYMDMNARDNLIQQFTVLGIPSHDEIDNILELVGLTGTGKKKAKDFSLGMRQRLGIAIALCGNPDLLILDEPINGLDPQGIIEIRELILKLNKEKDITFIISSHILDELSKIATNYGFIDGGVLVKEMSKEELEKSCRKAIHVVVNDTRKLVMAMDEIKIECDVISDTEADIFSDINISELVRILDKKGCELIQTTQKDESLESFYMNLVGGDKNE